jgi:hypothetical protein
MLTRRFDFDFASELNFSVISNSRLYSLSRALILAEETWGLTWKVTLYSTLPLRGSYLPTRFISSFQRLPERPNERDYQAFFYDHKFQESLCCFLFFTRLVPQSVYNTVSTINFHPSLLPEYPGLSGYDSAIAHSQLAVTAHTVDASIDGGSVLRQYSVAPFPEGASGKVLRTESSRLCTAAILSLLGELPSVSALYHQEFVSGLACIESVLGPELRA